MATLEIDLNCMCLFVPEPRDGEDVGSVHVLMPCTHHHSGHQRHVVRMLYRAKDGTEQYRDLEGWELVLGTLPGKADTTLEPAPGNARGVVVDLTDLTRGEREEGYRVPRKLITGNDHSVVSRITFHAGEVTSVDAQDAEWEMKGKTYMLAHKVTWRVDLPTEALDWKRLDGQADTQNPLPSLGAVMPDREDAVFRLHVHHVTEKAFERNGVTGDDPRSNAKFDPRVLDEGEIREHFRMFYALLGDPSPSLTLLPRLAAEPEPVTEQQKEDPLGGGGGWACKTAQASLEV